VVDSFDLPDPEVDVEIGKSIRRNERREAVEAEARQAEVEAEEAKVGLGVKTGDGPGKPSRWNVNEAFGFKLPLLQPPDKRGAGGRRCSKCRKPGHTKNRCPHSPWLSQVLVNMLHLLNCNSIFSGLRTYPIKIRETYYCNNL
jgi:hypothetical protein